MNDEKLDQKIERFLQGDEQFADEIFGQYFNRLVSLAKNKLSTVPPQVSDSEGAVISALRSFFSGLQRRDFPQLNNQADLWKVLATITVRKSIAQVRRHWKKSGSGGKMDSAVELNDLFKKDPTPDSVVSLVEECEKRIESLENEKLQQIASLTLAGYDTQEIADQLEVNRRTVQRKLELIRDIWRSEQ